MPIARYEVHTMLDAEGNPTGFYKLGKRSHSFLGLPLILCDHLHPSLKSARDCKYFQAHGLDNATTPLFGRIY